METWRVRDLTSIDDGLRIQVTGLLKAVQGPKGIDDLVVSLEDDESGDVVVLVGKGLNELLRYAPEILGGDCIYYFPAWVLGTLEKNSASITISSVEEVRNVGPKFPPVLAMKPGGQGLRHVSFPNWNPSEGQ